MRHINELWWKVVPNSVRFINDIVTAFKEGSSVVYVVSENCEWLDMLRSIIREKIFSGIDKTYEISGGDTGSKSPGEYLSETFVKKDLRAAYRTSIGYESFLTRIESETSLIHSYVFLKELSEKQTREWINFIDKYNKLHKPDTPRCKFIIESTVLVTDEAKGIRVFKRNDYLHIFDITILCMMAVSSFPMKSVFKEYSTELAALCSNYDPEFAAELINGGEEFIKDTRKAIEMIVLDSSRSNNELYHQVDDLNRFIWKAQLKVFFPLIEQFRLHLIEKYKSQIPIDKCITNMKGEELKSVYDVELGTIKWLCSNGELYLSSDDYNELKFFKDCRNELAHLKAVSYDSLKRITSVVEKL